MNRMTSLEVANVCISTLELESLNIPQARKKSSVNRFAYVHTRVRMNLEGHCVFHISSFCEEIVSLPLWQKQGSTLS
jgi:hypothetical protein